jgi:hypothetical protein
MKKEEKKQEKIFVWAHREKKRRDIIPLWVYISTFLVSLQPLGTHGKNRIITVR